MVRGAWTMQYQGAPAYGHQYKGTSVRHPDGAFVARMKSGHTGIFKRTGGVTSDGSDEIMEIMGGSIPQMLGHENVAQRVTDEAYEVFEKELNEEVYRILYGSGAGAA